MHFHIGFVKNTGASDWADRPTDDSPTELEKREKAAMDNHAA
jgi:hypothetical protein